MVRIIPREEKFFDLFEEALRISWRRRRP